jgi:hypothetical protein
MRQSPELPKHQPSSSHRAASGAPSQTPSNERVIVVPSRPQVTVLSNPDPFQQIPALAISITALLLSLYTLRKTLAQKRDEHRAKFFHEVVVGPGLTPLLRFYEDLRRYVEKEGLALVRSTGAQDHDRHVMNAMRKVREIKRSAATRTCGLVSAFSVNLETEIQGIFDAAADAAIEYLEECASGTPVSEPIAPKLAACQRATIERLREHEFQLGWPHRRFWIRRGNAA